MEGTREILTVAEAATLLRVAKRTIYRLVDSGQLPAFRVGKSWRIESRDLPHTAKRPTGHQQ